MTVALATRLSRSDVMKSMVWMRSAVLPLLLGAMAAVAGAQGKGQDKGKGGGKGKAKSHDKVEAIRGRGLAKGRSERRIIVSESGGNVSFREFALSPRKGRRLAGLAVATAVRSGRDDDFVIMPVSNRVRVLNRTGAVLVDFDDDFRWSRVLDPSGVIITRPTTSDLTRDVLLDVLGSIVLNRLATHAVALGLQDPLTGRWLRPVDDNGPRVLLLSSGTRPVAEIVDVNRDGNADVMLVAVR